jgi:2-oxoglutarate dehydrogenase E2 component (dihydrolipoamide succinyltransferase)
MTINVTVPELGESVIGATIGEWHKQEGDTVAVGDVLVDLETDKVDIEVSAESAGVLVSIKQQAGEDVEIGDTLAEIDETAVSDPAAEPSAKPESKPTPADAETTSSEAGTTETAVTPVAQRLADEHGLDLGQIGQGSGTNGRITRQDVEAYLQQREKETEKETAVDQKPPAPEKPAPQPESSPGDGRREERVRLSRRRRTIAQHLVAAQQTAAMLTTFNDVDMSAVIEMRKRRGPAFQERHGVKLGFMSFFVKATLGALKAFPRLNAEIDGDEMVLKHYYDIGIAVGAEEGLVVPVVRNADRRSFADIEAVIRDLAQKAQAGSLALEDLRGGTFTITNGGIFGSMLSTPILNTPQVGILGMHRIDDRPIARNGDVVIRPMMYLALSYDHRLVDGQEAVQFLARIKELIEDPETLLLEV